MQQNLATGAVAITPSDDDNLANPVMGIYVGTTGDLKVTMVEGDTVEFIGVPAGTTIPIWVKKVFATTTGTAAEDLIGFK